MLSDPRRVPCRGCPDRHEACHDHCERFKAFREIHAQAKAEQYAEADIRHARISAICQTKKAYKGGAYGKG